MARIIGVVAHQSRWRDDFVIEAQALRGIFGARVVATEHIWSTAVPGGECLDAEIPGTPGRYYFSRNAGELRTHQVHVCSATHPQVADLLAFRDYLRAHPPVARAYEAVKTEAAVEHRHAIIGYMHHKAAFMAETIRAARQWTDCRDHTELRK